MPSVETTLFIALLLPQNNPKMVNTRSQSVQGTRRRPAVSEEPSWEGNAVENNVWPPPTPAQDETPNAIKQPKSPQAATKAQL